MNLEIEITQEENKSLVRSCLALIQEELDKIHPNLTHKNDGVVRIPPGNSYQANFEIVWRSTGTLICGTNYLKNDLIATGSLRLEGSSLPEPLLVIRLQSYYGAPTLHERFDPIGICFQRMAKQISETLDLNKRRKDGENIRELAKHAKLVERAKYKHPHTRH